jgi:hypothetical protein
MPLLCLMHSMRHVTFGAGCSDEYAVLLCWHVTLQVVISC